MQPLMIQMNRQLATLGSWIRLNTGHKCHRYTCQMVSTVTHSTAEQLLLKNKLIISNCVLNFRILDQIILPINLCETLHRSITDGRSEYRTTPSPANQSVEELTYFYLGNLIEFYIFLEKQSVTSHRLSTEDHREKFVVCYVLHHGRNNMSRFLY